MRIYTLNNFKYALYICFIINYHHYERYANVKILLA
jgi:hypothetical protein